MDDRRSLACSLFRFCGNVVTFFWGGVHLGTPERVCDGKLGQIGVLMHLEINDFHYDGEEPSW